MQRQGDELRRELELKNLGLDLEVTWEVAGEQPRLQTLPVGNARDAWTKRYLVSFSTPTIIDIGFRKPLNHWGGVKKHFPSSIPPKEMFDFVAASLCNKPIE